jgi:RNA polymerase sigma-70 factor (ECF subfamily)
MTDTTQALRPADRQWIAIIAARNESAQHWTEAEAAYERLYAHHARMLLAFLSSRVRRSELEDVHQEIWSRVWQHLPTQFDGNNFRAWLFRIARNYIIQAGRRKRPELTDELHAVMGPESSPDIQLVECERMEILKRCLSRLDEALADLVRSRLSGESYEDICTRLSLAPARAHKLFHTAKAQLTACVERASGGGSSELP